MGKIRTQGSIDVNHTAYDGFKARVDHNSQYTHVILDPHTFRPFIRVVVRVDVDDANWGLGPDHCIDAAQDLVQERLDK